jgi:hypothetical protein
MLNVSPAVAVVVALVAGGSAAEPPVMFSASSPGAGPSQGVEMVVYKTPTCGCCGLWTAHVEEYGFSVTVHELVDLSAVKEQHGVPPELVSCHTAIVDGYVIEGHVPAPEILRLLQERPDVLGIATPGMPVGSPGMGGPSGAGDEYSVVTFDSEGRTTVYAVYRGEERVHGGSG